MMFLMPAPGFSRHPGPGLSHHAATAGADIAKQAPATTVIFKAKRQGPNIFVMTRINAPYLSPCLLRTGLLRRIDK
jgi:hypothetical protein